MQAFAELEQGGDTERLATRTTNPEQEPMSTVQINPEFVPVLELMGQGAGDFFLVAGLYHAHKISFAAAAALAGLGFDEFNYRLRYGHRGRDGSRRPACGQSTQARATVKAFVIIPAASRSERLLVRTSDPCMFCSQAGMIEARMFRRVLGKPLDPGHGPAVDIAVRTDYS